jgi:hypothetical protein
MHCAIYTSNRRGYTDWGDTVLAGLHIVLILDARAVHMTATLDGVIIPDRRLQKPGGIEQQESTWSDEGAHGNGACRAFEMAEQTLPGCIRKSLQGGLWYTRKSMESSVFWGYFDRKGHIRRCGSTGGLDMPAAFVDLMLHSARPTMRA